MASHVGSISRFSLIIIDRSNDATYALVAQLDRVPGFEPGGRRFESFRVRFLLKRH